MSHTGSPPAQGLKTLGPHSRDTELTSAAPPAPGLKTPGPHSHDPERTSAAPPAQGLQTLGPHSRDMEITLVAAGSSDPAGRTSPRSERTVLSLAIVLLPLVIAGAIFAATPVLGYLKLGTRVGSRTANIKWNDFPVRYYVTERGTTGVTAQQFQTAIATSFGVWDAVESADLSSEFAGFTAA